MPRSSDYAVAILLTLLAGVVAAAVGHLPPWPVFLWVVGGAFAFCLTKGRA